MTPDPTRSTPALVLLHFFGNSQREWRRIAPRLSARHRLLMFDMPGFGDAAALGALDVTAMADHVDRQIRDAGIDRCVVVGHSMTGKICGALASREPAYLRGLILVTPSPPPPEPFTDEVRARLMAFDGSREAAAAYVDGITAGPLPDEWREPAIADAMRASLVAWKTWISTTSQEDWSDRVGVLSLPVRVVAGADDPSLGADIQRRLTMPHLGQGELQVIAGGHVLPLENPDALTKAIETFGPVRDRGRSSPSSDLGSWGCFRPIAVGRLAVSSDRFAAIAVVGARRISDCFRPIAAGRVCESDFDYAVVADNRREASHVR